MSVYRCCEHHDPSCVFTVVLIFGGFVGKILNNFGFVKRNHKKIKQLNKIIIILILLLCCIFDLHS